MGEIGALNLPHAVNTRVPLLALFLGLSASPAFSQRPFQGEPDPALVAVRVAAHALEPDLAALGERVGVRFADARRAGPPDFRLLELAAPVGDPAARRRMIGRLAAEPGLDYVSAVHRNAAGLPEFPTPWILLRFRPGVPEGVQRRVLAGLADLRVEEERFGDMQDAWKLFCSARTGARVLARVAELATLPGVKWAESDPVMGVALNLDLPSDPDFALSWGLHNTGQDVGGMIGIPDFDMDAPEAWELTTGDPSVVILVMDVGVQFDHPDLVVWAGADFTGSGTGGGPTAPCASHGTAVSGCVAALMDNGLGTTGVAPGCRIASASIAVDADCDAGHTSMASWFVNALTWGQSVGARVATSSVGPFTWSQALADKYDQVDAAGMVLFAAAGNDPAASIGHPGDHPDVHAVGGVASNGASYGTTGNDLHLVAPAVNIHTTDLGGGFVTASGTSLASPYAAGVAGLVVSRHPSITSYQVELCLELSCRDLGAVGYDSTFGYGLLNARKSVAVADADLGAMQTDITLVVPVVGSGFPATVAQGVADVTSGGLIVVRNGAYDEALTISKPLVMRAWDAPVVIGN